MDRPTDGNSSLRGQPPPTPLRLVGMRTRVSLSALLLAGLVASCTTGRPAPIAPQGAASGAAVTAAGGTATDMHARDRGDGPVTYGRADVDDDGRADLVTVSTSGQVTVTVARRDRVVTRVRPDPSLRLQALPDLFGDGRHEILLAISAAGCCGYRLVEAETLTLEYRSGALHLLRLASGRPFRMRFSAGRGDVFAGVRCRARQLTQLRVRLLGPARLRATRTVYVRRAATMTRAARVSRTERGGFDRAVSQTRTSCAGLDPDGWAP